MIIRAIGFFSALVGAAIAANSAERPQICAVAAVFGPLEKGALNAADECIKVAVNPKDKAPALHLRARALLWTGSRDWQAMIDAATAALKANPKDDWPRLVRGQAHLRSGNVDLALADLNLAIKSKRVRDIEGPNARLEWAAAQIAKNNWKKAEAEAFALWKEMESDPRVSGIAYVTAQRAGDKAKVSELTSHVLAWPVNAYGGHYISMFLGRLTPDEALMRALDSGAEFTSASLCTTHFLAGEYYMIGGHTAEAKKHFDAAIATGTVAYPEFAIAQVEVRKFQP